jgi:mxaK protein
VRRRTVHIAFGAVAIAFATFLVVEDTRLREARRVNEAIATTASSGESARSGAAAEASRRPEAQFVGAIAAARSGNYDAALKTYKSIGRDAPPPLASAALYNAGNLQLRQALKEGPDAVARALPLIELSKQNYRAALRLNPHDWDTRYNLERALWLAPEVEETQVDRIRRDVEERVMSTLQSTRADLP